MSYLEVGILWIEVYGWFVKINTRSLGYITCWNRKINRYYNSITEQKMKSEIICKVYNVKLENKENEKNEQIEQML